MMEPRRRLDAWGSLCRRTPLTTSPLTNESRLGLHLLVVKERELTVAYSYRCGDYPGMEACSASFTSETQAELWSHIELHAAIAHKENPEQWSPEDRRQIDKLIRS